MYARLNVQKGATACAFACDRPDDTMLSQPLLNRAAGAVPFRSDFSKLPKAHAGIVWETTCSLNPPVPIRALKPKIYLLGKITLDAGTMCEIV